MNVDGHKKPLSGINQTGKSLSLDPSGKLKTFMRLKQRKLQISKGFTNDFVLAIKASKHL